MKFMIVFLFGFVTVGQVISEAVQAKDIYGGKRDDDHGESGRYVVAGKGLMPGIQYATNPGHATHYILAPASQQQSQKYQLAYSSNSHQPSIDAVPYPGVHYYPSKLGPIQYTVAPHQPMSYQPPIQMILAAMHPNPPHHHHRGHNGPAHHVHMNGGHITIGVPAAQKYSPAPYNAISPVGHHVVHLPAPHHGHRHQQSGFVPISIPVQSHHRHPAVSHAVAVYPTAQVTYAPTASAPQPHHHQQQQEEQHSTIQAPQVTSTTTVLQPSQHYASVQSERSQAYQEHYAGSQNGQNQHYQQQQQPHFSYSIQPSIQVASTKQVAAPSGPTPQFKHESFGPSQYSNDPSLASSYVSLVREYTMNPGSKGPSHVQQVYYPTPSTPVYSTSKPYVMTHVQPTGPGSTVEYSSSGAGGVQFGNQYYQQLSGKASAVSSTKYA